MIRQVPILALCFGLMAIPVHAKDIILDHDDFTITQHTKIEPDTYPIVDLNDNGAVLIQGNGITVDFQGAGLVGFTDDRLPDAYAGKGIVLQGQNITLKNVKVHGFKVGIYANKCPGLLIEDVDVSGNYRQHLKSTPQAEDISDWIYPHHNDQHEWITRYGAGLIVEKSSNVTLRRVQVRHGQNGIILDRVNDSRVYDNDCSFLSGWGLALWRCNRNVISRNAFDFCIRGYSHGVYNRGQDSAGILMFEQNNDNIIAENSATHCGDGFFGFGGQASLAGSARTGNNNNLLINNDFSYAAAHGIEMTFSLDNQFINNRLVGNAICGIWGGYSQNTLIAGNFIANNGESGYGLERGGINIEHGSGNIIKYNKFQNNKCGIHLWWDDDGELLEKPWVKANHQGSNDNSVLHNRFDGDLVGIHLRETTNTTIGNNTMVNVKQKIVADEESTLITIEPEQESWTPPVYPDYGSTRPVGARPHMQGRHHIIVSEWGPYDFTEFALIPQQANVGRQTTLQVLGPEGTFNVFHETGPVRVFPQQGKLPGQVTVTALEPGLSNYRVDIYVAGRALSAHGTLLFTEWNVRFYKWKPGDDPRLHPDKWKSIIAGQPLAEQEKPSIDFKWGGGAPVPKVPADHFGTVATTTLMLPEGKFQVRTISDDGIRVWIDDHITIDDWTWHPPKEHNAIVDLKAGKHSIRIEHFEIDGNAQLQFWIRPAK